MQKWKELLTRSCKEAMLQIWRNKFLSGSAILLGAMILFLLNFVFAVEFYIDSSLKNLESRADFSVKLRNDLDIFTFDALKNDLQKFPVDLKILKKEKKEDIELPARLNIKFQNLKDVSSVFEILKNPRYDSVIGPWDGRGEKEFVMIIDKLLDLRKNIETASYWLIGIFIAGGFLLIVNTFRLVLFARREEVYIARVVGADIKFISWPFVGEGIILGILASLIAIILFIFILREINILPGGAIFLHFWNFIFSKEILISGIVGGLGAWISVKRYLVGKFS